MIVVGYSEAVGTGARVAIAVTFGEGSLADAVIEDARPEDIKAGYVTLRGSLSLIAAADSMMV